MFSLSSPFLYYFLYFLVSPFHFSPLFSTSSFAFLIPFLSRSALVSSSRFLFSLTSSVCSFSLTSFYFLVLSSYLSLLFFTSSTFLSLFLLLLIDLTSLSFLFVFYLTIDLFLSFSLPSYISRFSRSLSLAHLSFSFLLMRCYFLLLLSLLTPSVITFS